MAEPIVEREKEREQPIYIAPANIQRKRGPKLNLTKELITQVLTASLINKQKYAEICARFNLNYSQVKCIERDYATPFMETIQVNHVDIAAMKDYWSTEFTKKHNNQ